jgi:hypothetical protein
MICVKASFGFGDNVCWARLNHALRAHSSTAREPQSLALPTRWITRSDVKVDRVACPWLIRRFIDPRAGVFIVPEEQLLETARQIGATVFDANRFQEVKLISGPSAVHLRRFSRITKSRTPPYSVRRSSSEGLTWNAPSA